VTKDMSKPLQNEYIETVIVEHDWGLRRDYAIMPRDYMPSETLTLASSEDIMMKHPLVKEAVADRNGEIEWGDFETYYGLSLVGMGGSANPGYELLELLTGIAMPSADYAWLIQFGTVYESGSTFTAAVDANTGEIVYVSDIEGTALMGLFG